MKRTLIVTVISISSLSFAVYTQATHSRKADTNVTAMKTEVKKQVIPFFHMD
ncbi:MAG TPA: hypothetical protein VD905_13745 [Flavobacteriales bacterium]|nr:hypothetical protein [Flavobacteriales bacterium]